jgi:hypothetical protein
MNICRNQVVATRNIARSRVSVRMGQQSNPAPYRATARLFNFHVEESAHVFRASLNQALNVCQDDVARRYGVTGDRIGTGVCRISPTGESEDFRRW